MAHGGPDYGIAAPSVYAFPIVTNEDLFLRQGLIKTLDGKGDIIFHDSFEHGPAKWHDAGSYPNASIGLSPNHAFGGNWALKFTAPSSDDPTATAAATIPVDKPDRYGVEFRFTYPNDYHLPKFFLYYYDLEHYYSFGIQYNSLSGKLRYHAPLDNWTDFATVRLEVLPLYYFHPIKLVIDVIKLEYVKFIFRGKEYDLTGKSTTVENITSRRAIQPRFWWQYFSGDPNPSYLDDVIVTENEP